MNEEQRQEQYETDGSMVIVVICLVSIISAAAGCFVAWVLMRTFGG